MIMQQSIPIPGEMKVHQVTEKLTVSRLIEILGTFPKNNLVSIYVPKHLGFRDQDVRTIRTGSQIDGTQKVYIEAI